MRYRAVVLSLCGVLSAGVVAAPSAAAAAPANCVDPLVAALLSAPVPDPTTIVVRDILPCVLGVVEMIREDLRGGGADDETYLRYYQSDSEGLSINGEYAVSDALAIAGCVV